LSGGRGHVKGGTGTPIMDQKCIVNCSTNRRSTSNVQQIILGNVSGEQDMCEKVSKTVGVGWVLARCFEFLCHMSFVVVNLL